MITFTDQEWILVFAVLVALIVFIAAVICILYALIRALRLEEAREQIHVVSMVHNTAPLEIFPRHSEHSINLEEKPDKVVLEMEADKEKTGETQTQSSYTQMITCANSPCAASPESVKTMPSPTDEDSSTLDVEFEKKSEPEYERRLAESEFLMKKLREQLAGHSKNDRKVKFVDEPEIMTGMPPSPASPDVMTPRGPLSPIIEPVALPVVSPIFAPQSFAEAQSLSSKSARKPLDRGQLPPLKSFTPPRTLTPRFHSFGQAPMVTMPQKPKLYVGRRTLKRPYSSIYKPVVHKFDFE